MDNGKENGNYYSIVGLYRGYIRAIFGLYRDITPIMENQMEQNIENEMKAPGPFQGVYRGYMIMTKSLKK